MLGYPTANLVVKDYVHIPASGVYTVDVTESDDNAHARRGFASIGFNDTFDGKERTIEVHIFDFDGEIYGEQLTVRWLSKIRNMVKFDGKAALINRMKLDESIARSLQ